MLTRSSAKYASLDYHSRCTQYVLSMKGGVVELLLPDCRETDPSVAAETREWRLRLNALIVEWNPTVWEKDG